MMDRPESGEVLLTTCIGQVLGDIHFRIVSGDAAPGEFVTELELAQLRKLRRLAEAEDFPVVEPQASSTNRRV
jgi:hypothetical protein